MASLFRFKSSSKFELDEAADSLYHKFVNISSVAVRICPWVWFCGEEKVKLRRCRSDVMALP